MMDLQHKKILKQCYEALYSLAGAKASDHFVFTSSGAEAINHIIFSAYLDITRQTGKNHFVTSTIEDAPTILSLERLCNFGCIYDKAPVDSSGKVTASAIAETISPRTALISISWAHPLTGVIQPVREIAQICRERGILFHVDATHMLGKGDYTLESSGADLLSFNGSDLLGPLGTGGFFMRKEIEISPFIIGSAEQGGLRAGEVNLQLFTQMAEAAIEAKNTSDQMAMEVARLRHYFEENTPGKVLFSDQERAPHLSTVLFPGIASDALAFLLKRKGVDSSFGGGNMQNIMHVLKACQIREPRCHSGLNFRFTAHMTQDDVEKMLSALHESVSYLKTCSQEMFAWD